MDHQLIVCRLGTVLHVYYKETKHGIQKVYKSNYLHTWAVCLDHESKCIRMYASVFVRGCACISFWNDNGRVSYRLIESHRKRCPHVFLNYRFNQLNGYKIPKLISLRHSSMSHCCRAHLYQHKRVKKITYV